MNSVSNMQIDSSWVASTVLLWIRLSALFFMTPVFAGFKGPTVVLAVLSLGMSGLLAAGWPHATEHVSAGSLALGGLTELFVGSVMAFGVHCAFAVFSAAGQIVDLQIGFGAGATFDPATRTNAPVLAAALSSLAVMTFFAMDAHHALLRGLAFSVAQVPPGTFPATMRLDAIVRQFGSIFTFALAMIAPVFVMMLLVEYGLAVISRLLPQMNIFFVGMPIKIMGGLTMLAIAAPAFSSAMARVYASIFTFWDRALR